MKKRNSVRNLLMVALLVGGIFVVGAETQAFAQDRSGYIIAGNRSGYISSSGGTGSSATSSTGDAERSGYLVAGNRAQQITSTQPSSEAEFVTILDTLLAFFL